MVLKLVKKLADPKFIKNLADDVVKPVSKQTDEALEESFFKIKDDVASPDKKDYLTLNNDTYKTLRGIPDESLDKKSAEELFFSGEDNINTIRKNQSSFRKQEKAGNRPFKKEALQLEKEEITPKEFRKVAFEDVKNFESLDELNTFTEVVFSLDKNKRAKGIIGLDKTIPKNVKPIEAGDGVKARLDIPAYNEFDVYVPQITYKKPDVSGAESVFARTMVIENVTFPTPTKAAFNISRGIENKYPHATINGTVAANPTTKKMYTDKEAHNFAKEIFNDDSWSHLGYNPDRGGFFYDRKTKMPVFDSPLVIQIGKQIFAKKSSETAAERILKIRKMDLRKAVPKKKKAALFDTGGDVKRELVGTPTKEKTKAGRTVYRTKEGERVSEKSATVGPIEGKYYNVPSIYAGKRYTDDELREAIKNNRLIPTSVHDSRPEAEAAAKKRSNELNKGGAMLNQQMKMAFMQEGGLKDEGGTVDPVSGNDVPSGSMQEEVRDDVPAMLSEGEFVFPADVVRYIGLSKLMQMRQQAKMGLKIMEEMGQMGNSEEATLPDDFGIPDIEIIEDDEDEAPEMAQGGVIEAQQGTDVQNTMYRRSENRPSVGAVLMPDGTIDNSAMMDLYNRRQPQQTQFEQMMGYGAGQGSNPYGSQRVPYTKEDGTIINVLEDYMGRPMENIEGLERVTPYQAGPVIGSNIPAGGGGNVQPLPVIDEGTGITYDGKELSQEQIDKLSKIFNQKQIDKFGLQNLINRVNNTRIRGIVDPEGVARIKKEKRKEKRGDTFDRIARDRNRLAKLRGENTEVSREDVIKEARRGQTDNMLENLRVAGDDLKNRSIIKDLKNQIESLKKDLKSKTDTIKQNLKKDTRKALEIDKT